MATYPRAHGFDVRQGMLTRRLRWYQYDVSTFLSYRYRIRYLDRSRKHVNVPLLRASWSLAGINSDSLQRSWVVLEGHPVGIS